MQSVKFVRTKAHLRSVSPFPFACNQISEVSRRSLRISAVLENSNDAKETHENEPPSPQTTTAPASKAVPADTEANEVGRMSRRLQELTEQSISDAGVSSDQAIREAGFSSELAQKLQERIAHTSFQSKHAQAVAQSSLSSSTGQGTQDIAGARPWTGSESTEDAVLRMLSDSHKPLKVSKLSEAPAFRPPKLSPNLPRRNPKAGAGQRLAAARDKSSTYSLSKDLSLSKEEREKMRQELKDRFQPGARPMPSTIQGLRSLANERIEDAIARGLFKNLPRGKEIDRDYNASSPFIDTTEYLLNRLVQRQDVVPPWIEKQQEITLEIQRFRTRLRSEWRRHAARAISSKGGSLNEQMKRADDFAKAELLLNPKPKLAEKLKKGSIESLAVMDEMELEATLEQITAEAPRDVLRSSSEEAVLNQSSTEASPRVLFRDPKWEENQRSYHELSIATLNNTTRSYNLMAPDLVKKPYFDLRRELDAVYRDVAPQLAAEIHMRATAPKSKAMEYATSYSSEGPLNRFTGQSAKVWDEKKPRYGLKEFLRDIWSSDKT